METLYTVKQLASIFDVTEYTIRCWINDGRLKAFKPSDKKKGHWRVSESEVRKLAETKYGARKIKENEVD